MYHQMSILSAPPPPPPPPPLVLPLSSTHSSVDAVAAPSSPSSGYHCLQVGRELEMEVETAEKADECFSVDELLNLWNFEENEKERVENKEVMEHCWNASCELWPPVSQISLPAHDDEELEWLSFIIDDSLLEFPAEVAPFPSLPKVQNGSDDPRRESSQRPNGPAVAIAHDASLSCATVCVVSTEAPVPPKAKRSKRPRALTVGWSSSLPSSDSSSTTSAASASSSSFSSCLLDGQTSIAGDQSYLLYESYPSLPPPPPPSSKKRKLPKKRGRKPKQQPASAGSSGSLASSGERRCSHCGVQKTPQWRAGPLGAKTLCNACGVRYKSGRLLPEYRPACSPTYVDSIHSSSHRKVLELRRRKEAEFLGAGPPPVATC